MIKRTNIVEIKKWTWAAAAVALIGAMQSARADIVVMSDGKQQVGVVVENKTDARNVMLRTISGEIMIPRTKISRIETQTPSQSYGALGDQFLAKGDFEQAIKTYETGLQFDAGNLDLQQKIQQARGGVANLDADHQVALDQRARRVVDQAMKLASEGNFEKAFNEIRSIEPSDVSPVHADYNRALVNLYMMWGQNLFDHQNTGGAAEKFNEVLKLDPENAQAKQLLIRTFEGDPTKLQEMASYYSQSSAPEDQLKGAESLFKLQQYEQALPIYMKYMSDADLARRYNITQRLQFILDTLHQQYASRGDYRTALQYFSQYMQVKPDADPTPYSKYVYMIKRSETDMNDAASRLALADLADRLGLVDTSKEEYKNVLALDAKSTGALTAMRRFAEADLADAREFMAQGQFTLASQKAETMTGQYGMFPDLIALANQVQAQAKVEAQKVQQNTRQEARALAERGDNYYQQAMQYIGAYASTETDINKRIFSPRNEAAKYLSQAIFAWKTAVQMDPTLGDPTTYNLYFKIRDASAQYARYGNRTAPALPPRPNRPSRR